MAKAWISHHEEADSVNSRPALEHREPEGGFFLTRIALMGLGLLDGLAFLAVVAPTSVLDQIHRLCGLGEMPSETIVGYLARSGSLLYALHGTMILFMATNPRRYLPLIRFMACAAILHGATMLVIDCAVGMPLWWRCAEGPGFAATGVVVLLAIACDQSRESRARAS